MLKKLVYFHIIPFFIACFVAVVYIFLQENTAGRNTIIVGKQTRLNGRFGNLLAGDSAEINFIASIQNKSQFNIFGSSEFNELPVCPYNFFPDSLGIQMLGVGHAYHQSLGILVELLAADEYIDSTNKMCFIISPGWFATAGTNTEAFVEFARPNFLKRITESNTIPEQYKSEVGKYIAKNEQDFEGLSPTMEVLINQYKIFEKSGFSKLIANINNYIQKKLSPAYSANKVEYDVELKYMKRKTWTNNFDSIANNCQKEFIKNITTNNLYVYDDYYTKYLSVDGAPYEQREIAKIDTITNIEYQQFKALKKYLQYKNVDASFVILPHNPYCYNNLSENSSFYSKMDQDLEKSGFSCYNLYVSDTANYDKGLLKDVMHLGDFGWMKVNKFIFETYYDQDQ
ncbi:MAG: D-alanyl-lipoteichoic acid biosynthesis protein DltD [Crocinitomicaceae bacterium]